MADWEWEVSCLGKRGGCTHEMKLQITTFLNFSNFFIKEGEMWSEAWMPFRADHIQKLEVHQVILVAHAMLPVTMNVVIHERTISFP